MNPIDEYSLPPFIIKEYAELPSTNDFLKSEAINGAPDGLVAVARRQTAGKGRLGRSFFSPGSGLYMSVLLRRDIPAASAHLITPMAAVAVAESLEALGSEPAGIKWVNDIYIAGKKVCGILTETGLSGDCLDYAVVGIGVNICDPEGGYPPEIADRAGSAFIDPPSGAEKRLAAEILKRLDGGLRDICARGFLDEYRRRSVLIGKRVEAAGTAGTAVGIDSDCRLVIKTDDGREISVGTGEVNTPLTFDR